PGPVQRLPRGRPGLGPDRGGPDGLPCPGVLPVLRGGRGRLRRRHGEPPHPVRAGPARRARPRRRPDRAVSRPAPADPRAARTRERLREALLEECAERPLAEVGVAALVRRAGVGRATFYVHYADLEALAVDACADVVREA